jgi:NAD(P)-dependent dehydrogenase (short-subunit alcohol dehydrogenase family)
MQLLTQGQRVLVTAGAAGIGRAIAQTFAGGGARVFVCDIDDAALQSFRSTHPQIGGVRCDVADDADVGRMFDAALSSLGGLDVLVNNAGIAGPTGKIEDLVPADWERTMAVNVNGMYYCTRRAMPVLKANGGGLIVNLSSAAGKFGFPLRSPYSASKWAVVGLSKSLAMEAGPQNIRVNAICPGIVEGDRIDRVVAAKAKLLGQSEAEFRAQWLQTVSMRTMVSAQDIANMVFFLATPAGAKISGQALSVDGNVETLR